MSVRLLRFLMALLLACNLFGALPVSSAQTLEGLVRCTDLPRIERTTPEAIKRKVSGVLAYSLGAYRFLRVQGVPTTRFKAEFKIIPLYDSKTDGFDLGLYNHLSPDQSKVLRVIRRENSKTLVVILMNPQGNSVKFTFQDSRFQAADYIFWLDSKTIAVNLEPDNERIYNYALVSAIDGSTTSLQLQIDDRLGPPVTPVVNQHWPPLLNATRTRAAYVRSRDDKDDLVILDIGTSTVIAHSPAASISGIPRQSMKWSPLGNFLAFAKDTDPKRLWPLLLSVLSRDGQLVAQTQIYAIEGIKWSPDERYLLVEHGETQFRYQYGPFAEILNVRTGQVTRICLPGEYFWSPDGRYIAIIMREGVFVYDMTDGKVYEISVVGLYSLGEVLGWANVQD